MAEVVGNSKFGLLNLPDELLLEILSHYPSSFDLTSSSDIDQHLARRDTLCALSQTCRKLWRFFRPFIWNNVEVYRGMQVLSGSSRLPMVYPTRSAQQAKFVYELSRQLDIVTNDPNLSEHVRCVLDYMLTYSKAIEVFYFSGLSK